MEPHQIAISVSAKTVKKLIEAGELCLQDLTCLDKTSKQAVQKYFLTSLLVKGRN